MILLFQGLPQDRQVGLLILRSQLTLNKPFSPAKAEIKRAGGTYI